LKKKNISAGSFIGLQGFVATIQLQFFLHTPPALSQNKSLPFVNKVDIL
jgi:hypothetical protein